MTSAVRITITGAAGQIGYQLAFRVASGDIFGPDQPVILQLLEIPPALDALQGVRKELSDCAFSTLDSIVATDQADVAFLCHVVFLDLSLNSCAAAFGLL